MSFPILCPGCDAEMTVPDTVAGKRIKCKSCAEVFVARRQRRREDDEPPPDSGRTSRRDDEDDDDRPRRSSRRDDRDTPRRKKAKKAAQKSGPPALLFILLGVGALLLVGGGVGIYFGFIKDRDKAPTDAGGGGLGLGGSTSGQGSVSGWMDYQSPTGLFSMKVPGNGVTVTRRPATTPAGQNVQVDMYTSDSTDTGIMVITTPIPGEAPLDDAAKNLALETAVNSLSTQQKGLQILSRSTVTHRGMPARELHLRRPDGSEAKTRFIFGNGWMFNLLYVAKSGALNHDRARQFFESFRLVR